MTSRRALMLISAIGDIDPIRYSRPNPDGQFSGNILDEAMRPSGTSPGGSVRGVGGCGGDMKFDPQGTIAALSREVARLTEVIAEHGRLRGATIESASTRLARSTRSAVAAPVGGDERIERMVAAAPNDMKYAVREFASTAVMQFDIASGAISVPPPTELERIVGGNRVQSGAIPSCVRVGDARNWFCSGVVVAPHVVLTAAHCGANVTRVLVGDEVIPARKARVIGARAVIAQPKYRPAPLNENDINIVTLDTPAAVAPAKIATDTQLGRATEFIWSDSATTTPNFRRLSVSSVWYGLP